MTGLYKKVIEDKGAKSKQLLAKLLPKIARMLPPDSLLGRTVVGHNDMHGECHV